MSYDSPNLEKFRKAMRQTFANPVFDVLSNDIIMYETWFRPLSYKAFPQ